MGDRLEERKDFTAEVTAKLPEAKKLAQVRRDRGTYGCVCVRARVCLKLLQIVLGNTFYKPGGVWCAVVLGV